MARVRRFLYLTTGFGLGTLCTLLYIMTRSAYEETSIVVPESPNVINLTSHSPLIFVGGFPRSGTTLMRILLDTHPDVRCGPETRVIPRVLIMRDKWFRTPSEARRLADANLLGEPIDRAVAAFILEIMRNNGPMAPRLCNKDPLALKHMSVLAHLYPNAKFVLMLRDGRAVAHSVKKRTVTISGLNWNDPWDVLKHWDSSMQVMVSQCAKLGDKRCFAVKYEDLVLQPEKWLKSIVSFLDLTWSPNLLHHKDAMTNVDGLHLSQSEKSTDQVVQPIHIKALTEWCDDDLLSKDFIYKAHLKSPMLAHLKYDIEHIPPFYGKADPLVLQNTYQVQQKT